MSPSRIADLANVVLGSKSWSRRTLLSSILPDFTISAAEIDESLIRHPDPRRLVLLLGHAKADALVDTPSLSAALSGLPPRPRALLITGDSVVTHKGRILEKPRSEGEARAFLESYATAPATTVSAVVVTDFASGRRWDGVAEAEVSFQPLPTEVIDELIATGGSMESAGGLRIEHPKVQRYTDYILGEKSAVMGFSVPLVEELLDTALRDDAGEGGEGGDRA